MRHDDSRWGFWKYKRKQICQHMVETQIAVKSKNEESNCKMIYSGAVSSATGI